MAKLYIFGIGGTGSRVLRSLTMLMASGVKMNSEVIVPIIIDPDVAAADMTRTVELMRLYSEIRSRLNHSGNSVDGFYATEIKELVDSFRMELENTQNIRFDSYIGLSSMDDSNKALTKMLFSEDNLRSSMEVGFKGNPNIGSVVLNRFSQSDQFREFADSFEENDKIFIISSIFGGTGASGFPVLLKNIRTLHSSQTNLPQSANIENSVVGAITLLPYFGIKADPQSSIDQSTFISKTKAALSYYNTNMDGLDALYYLGDEIRSSYENCEGGQYQKNNAHFIELAAALSIVDFDYNVVERAKKTDYKEFGISESNGSISLPDLSEPTYDLIAEQLTCFTLFAKFMRDKIDDSIRTKQPWVKRFEGVLGGRYVKSYLNVFLKSYLEWLQEMKDNNRSFAPFVLEKNEKAVFGFVEGREEKKIWFKTDSNYGLFDSFLNDVEKNYQTGIPAERRLVELFAVVTKELVNKKIKL
jgi:hypothetical protein